MERLQTPVVAGMGGAAILSALLSFGGAEKKTTPPPSTPEARTSITNDEAGKSPEPNQDGPWRAVCEEYAPYGFGGEGGKDPSQIPRGYKVVLRPGAVDGATEVNTKPDLRGQAYKITVHKQLVGDLTSCIPPGELSNIHLIVATLPDPDKTEMRLEFDRYVDALEKGAEIQGFHYTGYWFPWRSQQRGEIPRKEDEVEAVLLRNEQPGILLFHNDGGERLFIFVVGETPTSGVNRIQMEQALTYRQEMLECYQKVKASGQKKEKDQAAACTASNAKPNNSPAAASGDGAVQTHETSPPTHLHGRRPLPPRPPTNLSTENAKLDGPLMIAGPHFSGSLASLHEVLGRSDYLIRAADNRHWVKIISDAAADSLIRQFASECSSNSSCNFTPLSVRASVTDKAVANYLNYLGYKNAQIAELVEDESGFGDEQSDKDNSPPGREPEPSPFGLILRFPRELSAVRALSDQQSEQLAESGAKILSLAKTPSPVKLSGQDEIERDRPSTYASEDQATEISNALEDRVRAITDKDIECIVISASNPLDRVFLLDYLHDRLPNVRLVAEEADELEISHPHYIDLTGTIVVSTFPTVPESAAVKGGHRIRVSFPSVAAEEQFLSVAILLQKVKTDYIAGAWMISIAGEEGFEVVPFKDGIEHQGVVDRGAGVFEPIAETGRQSEDGITLKTAGREETPRSFISFSIAIFALTTIHLLMLLNSRRSLKFAYVTPGGTGDFDRTFNLLALNNQFFLLNFMILIINPVVFPLQTGFWPGLQWISFGAWVMSIFMVVASLSSLYRFSAHVRENLKNASILLKDKLILLFFAFLVAWYLVSSIVFLSLWRSSAVAEWPRILTLDNGLSPVVPIATILLAWALWAALQLRRVKWITYRKMDLCLDGTSVQRSPLGKHLCEDMNDLHREIDAPIMGVRRVLFVFCFVGMVSWWQWGSLRGIEHYSTWTSDSKIGDFGQLIWHIFFPSSFEWWFAIWGFVMLLMTVMLAAYQLREIWLKLARLLYRLETTPMKSAFERLGKDDRIHIKIWDLGKTALRFDEMSLIIESLAKMGYCSEASTAKRILETYQHADLEGKQPNQQDRDELNKALNVRLAGRINQLDLSRMDTNGGLVELDRYRALRFVTLIRYVLLQMRNLMWFVIYGYFLAVVAVTFYPFQGGKNLSDLLAVTFVVVLLLMAMLVIAILRNPMLKRLEDPESNVASVLEPLFHLLSVGGLPALALLAWQFPWIGQMAFSWLRPLLSAFR